MKSHLLSNLLEAVQHGYTGDAVDLTEKIEAHRVKVLLAGYLSILDDGSG